MLIRCCGARRACVWIFWGTLFQVKWFRSGVVRWGVRLWNCCCCRGCVSRRIYFNSLVDLRYGFIVHSRVVFWAKEFYWLWWRRYEFPLLVLWEYYLFSLWLWLWLRLLGEITRKSNRFLWWDILVDAAEMRRSTSSASRIRRGMSARSGGSWWCARGRSSSSSSRMIWITSQVVIRFFRTTRVGEETLWTARSIVWILWCWRIMWLLWW